MHQKKRKILHNHSIPIGLCNYNHLVSYSIPLGCMVVLLLGSVVMVNPDLCNLLVNKTSAVTIQDEWVVINSNNSSDSNSNYTSTNGVNSDPSASPISSDSPDSDFGGDAPDEEFGGFGDDGFTVSDEDANAGISVHSFDSSIGITISDTDQTISTVQGGDTVYGTYTIGLTGTNVKDYTLSIKAGSTNLTMPSGASSSTSTVSGAGGKTGNAMTANTWGYKLAETSTTESSYGTLTYASLPTTATTIANSAISSPYDLSISKKLIFAAKFADTAAPGTYSAAITLSATMTPAVVLGTWSNGTNAGVTSMKDIKSGFCKSNSSIATGNTITLVDTRDSNPYTIVKLKDGNCWMQENLRLNLTTSGLSSTDTNITSNWNSSSSVKPTATIVGSGTTISGWDASSYSASSATFNNAVYGNYYAWCAATAGTCDSATTDGVIASGSICPKNWHLPTGGTNGEFYTLLNGLNVSTVTALPYNFSTAGYVFYAGSLQNAGETANYWTSTAASIGAYKMFFNSSSSAMGTGTGNKFSGFSVRCVASY